MGNSPNNEPRKAPPKSRFIGVIEQFLDYYGKFSGEQLRGWATENYSEQYSSVSYTNHTPPSYRRNREELIQALQLAHESGWRARPLQITSVENSVDKEIVNFNYAINVPNTQKPGQRIDLFFAAKAVFQTATGKWMESVFQQYIPQPPAPPREDPNYVGRFFRWWGNQICNNLESNMNTTNEALAWNARMHTQNAERARNAVEHRTVNRNGVNVHQVRRNGGGWADGY